MAQSFASVAICGFLVFLLWSGCRAQLAFHTDTNTNSFTLKAPGIQQTFTRYFGGQQGALLQQAQQSQQQQQVVPAPQNFAYQPTEFQQNAYNDLAQQQVQATQQQPQYLSAQDYAAYLQQIQAAQAQEQVQQTQFAARQQHQAVASQAPQAQVASPDTQPNNNLLGVAYSPSNQVSHVKFSSGGLAYNF